MVPDWTETIYGHWWEVDRGVTCFVKASVLEPLLFLVYALLSYGAIMLSLYAGDMLLLINLNTDLSHLQLDINSNDRVNKKITHLNPTKCKAILISLGNCSILQYGALVQHVDTFGVLLLWNQTWSSHINSICLKTRKLLRLLYRRLYGNVIKGRLKIYNPLGSLT